MMISRDEGNCCTVRKTTSHAPLLTCSTVNTLLYAYCMPIVEEMHTEKNEMLMTCLQHHLTNYALHPEMQGIYPYDVKLCQPLVHCLETICMAL